MSYQYGNALKKLVHVQFRYGFALAPYLVELGSREPTNTFNELSFLACTACFVQAMDLPRWSHLP